MLSLMRCISFARLNYLIKFSPVLSTPLSKVFFERPKPLELSGFDAEFGGAADRPLTHKSKNAASVPCSLRIFPSFTNHATTCLTVNCSIGSSASVAICLKGRKDATTKFVKKFSKLASSSIDPLILSSFLIQSITCPLVTSATGFPVSPSNLLEHPQSRNCHPCQNFSFDYSSAISTSAHSSGFKKSASGSIVINYLLFVICYW